MTSSTPMRFRSPVWLAVYPGLTGLVQLPLPPTGGIWLALHVLVAVLGLLVALYQLMATHTDIDEDGILVPGLGRRARYRWNEITFLGRRRRYDTYLAIVLADGTRKRLPNVPADAYPAIRDRFPIPLPGQERESVREVSPAR